MSFTGLGSFGNYDHTAQGVGTAGLPPHPRLREEDDGGNNNQNNNNGIGLSYRCMPASSHHHPATRTTSDPTAGRPPGDDGGMQDRPATSRASEGEGGGAGARGPGDTDCQSTRSTIRKETVQASDPAPSESLSDGGEDEDTLEEQRREGIVMALAREYTNHSHATVGQVPDGANVFASSTDPDSPLNPNEPHFSAKAWARAVAKMVETEGHSFRTSGVAFQDLNVFGFGTPTDYQKDFFNVWLEALSLPRRLLGSGANRRIDILRDFDGLVRKGEMLVVLGPPGSGCSTLLKTLAGDYNGIFIDDKSFFNYQGMTAKEMITHHRGEAVYTAEVDVHFPQLTVGDTLTFAAHARAPRHLPAGLPRSLFTNHLRDVVMAMFGISHTINTRVGNEYVRGVSGGERKRVTIAEATLSSAPLQCWDNSTRGLDSANAIEFCKTLRLQSSLFHSTAIVSIYQSPQSAYDLFDKACVLYEGRQIFFGRTTEAREYFINLGFECPARATTPDFLTSMTSPYERVVRKGWEDRAPRTPDEFAAAWRRSEHYKVLRAEIEEYKTSHPINGPDAEAFRASRREQQARGQRAGSPFTLSYSQQVRLCLWRGWRRLVGDPSLTVSMLVGNFFMALIIASVFFDLQPTTSSFFERSALLFFACLMNAFASALEILTLYAQRPIVEKHDRYALYHPSAEAVASMLCDMPYKVLNSIVFNLTLYFMTNLRREPGAFFFFLLITFSTTIAMSMIFRTIASTSRTLSQAMVPAAMIILALIIFTGFAIPITYMHGWCRWLNYLDPLAYAFEALMVNEFQGRDFTCTTYVPDPRAKGYSNVSAFNHVCDQVGSVAGQAFVNGDAYLSSSFSYSSSHRWRNYGIILVFIFGFLVFYMVAAEGVSARKSKGEVLVFRRGQNPAGSSSKHAHGGSGSKADDAEAGGTRLAGPVALINSRADGNRAGSALLQKQTSVFHWRNVCYEVKIKGESRRILDHVDGWVKPGTLTALMGVSGAGKTTLLDCLADRTSMGIITGEMLVDGQLRDTSFQRKTGYVQQQDLHLQTTTVREALNFSALLRQPDHVPRKEKLAYVDEVIKLLGMEEYAEAIIGVSGEGLNVEQRKRLTIGVELAAKPPLLLFVDEPTSGLDSQTSWAILDLLEKLTKSGQAILCTIHQPSAMLFQRFDRLLFLAKGGKTVYFGEIGENSKTMTLYFERNGGFPCPAEANPAEWMLEVIGAAPGTSSDIDWHQAWRNSAEYAATQDELARLAANGGDNQLRRRPTRRSTGGDKRKAKEEQAGFREFAAPFGVQLVEVTHRVFQQYWRTPSYIYSKMALCVSVALFIGFVFFRSPNTLQGLQNQMFAIFNLLTVFGQLVQQTMPHFVVQRSLYEVRERPSKVYGWRVFMLSQIIVELPWNTLMAAIMFFCWYYPIGLQDNAVAAHQTTERGALMFLLLVAFMLFTSTFTDLMIAGVDTAEAGGNLANLLFTLCLIFCGVLASPSTLPGFWIFMYRISPFTYLVSAMLSVGVANAPAQCATNEFLHFAPPSGQTCQTYMDPYLALTGGYLEPGTNGSLTDCSYCTVNNTNDFLKNINASYDTRWRNFGIMWAFIIFNIFGALGIYWLFRVPKKGGFLGFGKSEEEKDQAKREQERATSATTTTTSDEKRAGS